MKKLLYIIITLIILLGIGTWLKSQKTETPLSEGTTTQQTAAKLQANIEKQPIVKEDENGNMTVDGEIVEDIEENMPEDTGDEEETIINE